VRGGVRNVRVTGADEEELPVLNSGELEPLSAEMVANMQPPVASAPPVSDAGEEALRMMWMLADLLIERGLFTRAELTRRLRAR
jgi:hypothetical protein